MKSTKKCPGYHTISLANAGNLSAMEEVLQHYDAYISKSSLRPLHDEYGNSYLMVDAELKGLIRTALIQMIMKFELKVV